MSEKAEGAGQHGDTRSTGSKTVYGEERTLTSAATGAVLYRGPMSSQTYTTGEVYCGKCGGWQGYTGLMGALFATSKCPTCGADMKATGQGAGQA